MSLALLVLISCALAWAGHSYRKSFIQAIFVDGPGGDGPGVGGRAPESPTGPAALLPVERVRVVLIDGLSRESAHGLPNLDALCARGLDLTVDAGFPTVSLPVQHALWTGLTQAQTGIMFRGKAEITKHPRSPPGYGIPARVPESIAVAESHAYIVHALGFARAWPESAAESTTGSAANRHSDEFAANAARAVARDERLVFVHILRVDVAGHRGGRNSAGYREAARTADELLGALIAADASTRQSRTRWFVLSDHGHRGKAGYAPGGGHGGATEDIRLVRGCIVDALPRSLATPLSVVATDPHPIVHMVDISHALADSLGLSLPPASLGRSLQVALAAPKHSRVALPRASTGRVVSAVFALVLALMITGFAARGQWLALPWWWPVALVSIIWVETVPSLSHPMVYRALHPMVFVPMLPGLLTLVLQWALLAHAHRTQPADTRLVPWRVLLALLCLPLGAALAAGIMATGFGLWDIAVIQASAPPLMPMYTALTSVLLALGYAGALWCAWALAAWLAWSGRHQWRQTRARWSVTGSSRPS